MSDSNSYSLETKTDSAQRDMGEGNSVEQAR